MLTPARYVDSSFAWLPDLDLAATDADVVDRLRMSGRAFEHRAVVQAVARAVTAAADGVAILELAGFCERAALVCAAVGHGGDACGPGG